ncbi:DUF4349 domain-containing protein [Nocardiopsis deserti]|uniref:DUF4349 domain-containing protein n=1 Tax=Nocardiopsis deserti TaxID=2605988 RepID=UPI001CC248C4|nr:DUF4349 domain-containing protein [Nocardiopsis deserti]
MAISAFPPTRRVAGTVLSAGLAALLATSCSSPMADGGAGATSESAAVAPEAGDRALSEEQAGEQQSAEEGGGSAVGSEVEIGDRELVHTAELSVRVEDVSEAVGLAKELTLDAGGYVASERVSTPQGGSPEGTLTLRIPGEDYEGALEELSRLGDRSNLERSVEDVTEEVADVESRIESSEAALETLRGYLEEAEDVDDLLRVEGEIQTRQAELEAFQARLETLRNQTAYSTVHLTLTPPETYLEEPAEDSIGFLGGLDRGWRALVTFGQGVAVVVGWLLPFLAVAAVLGAGPLWWYRSRRRGPAKGAKGASSADGRKTGSGKGAASGSAASGGPASDTASGSAAASGDTARDRDPDAPSGPDERPPGDGE